MSDPTLPGTPGTGPLPEPEPEGFRDAQIEAERTRQVEERKTQAELNLEAAEKYSGKDYVPPAPPPEGGEGGAARTGSKTTHGSPGTKKS